MTLRPATVISSGELLSVTDDEYRANTGSDSNTRLVSLAVCFVRKRASENINPDIELVFVFFSETVLNIHVPFGIKPVTIVHAI